ncbi:cytochrome c-type biogenesis protein [Enterovirga rhinocerotis]|uniref:cytochrome c-type biogenesis protein n=1 Tax=Enterovirga rhinocerotis TaxID=1339210 RepID=UPI00105F0D7D|nr:cytochrome c-type biogenesis protein [Enterovirga rhinocerotis]
MIGLVCGLVLGAASALAVQPDEVLPDKALESRARAISAEIRCVVCQNQSIDDSDAPLARDLRVLVRERLKAGDNDAAIRSFIVERYGAFVLLRPPVNAQTLVLWFGPLVILALAAAGVVATRRRRPAPALQPLTAEEELQLAALADGTTERSERRPTGSQP